MILDGHVHIGVRAGLRQSVEELLRKMDTDKVDKSIVFNMVEAIDNKFTAKAMHDHPDRLIGFAVINPWAQDPVGQLKQSLDLGLKGLKLHPTLHGYNVSNHELVDPLLEVCSQRHVPVIGHGADDVFSVPLAYEELARTFPDVIFVIAHMGAVFLSDQARLAAKRMSNVFLGTEGALMGDITSAAAEAGPEKILMGTDGPLQSARLEIDKVRTAIPDKHAQELILGANWARLLNLV